MELSHDDIHAHNTFDAPENLRPRTELMALNGREFRHHFSPASVTVFKIRL
jgi:alpha-L-arabinofuranosidase